MAHVSVSLLSALSVQNLRTASMQQQSAVQQSPKYYAFEEQCSWPAWQGFSSTNICEALFFRGVVDEYVRYVSNACMLEVPMCLLECTAE